MTGHARLGAALAAVLLCSSGCAVTSRHREVNVRLLDDVPIYGTRTDSCVDANVVLVARCKQVEEYTTTTRGKAASRWFFTTWNVLRVEQGLWPPKTLSFVFHEVRPHREATALVDTTPMLYYPGAILAFCVETRKAIPIIVGQQSRSQVPPYGIIHRPIYDWQNPDNNVRFTAAADAAKQFVEKERHLVGTATVTEEYDTFYVVEVHTSEGALSVVVAKDSLNVRWADPNDS